MTSKVFGIPLIIICFVLAIIVPLGIGEMKIIQNQEEIKNICRKSQGVLLAEPTVTISPTPTMFKNIRAVSSPAATAGGMITDPPTFVTGE